MPNARIQSKVANAGLRNVTPAAKTSFSQLSHGRAKSPSMNSRVSESNVNRVTTTTVYTGGNSIGLLLSLTYSTVTTTTTVVSGGYGPHARIK